MNKKYLIVILLFAVIIGSFMPSQASPKIGVLIDGVEVKFKVSPIIINDRVMVPMRVIFEKLGAEVDWDQSRKAAIGIKSGLRIELPIDSERIIVNGERRETDAPARLVGNNTLVPVRYISEVFGYKVDWDKENKNVLIDTKFDDKKIGRVTNNFKTIELDMSTNEVEMILGSPSRVDEAVGGGYWYIYNNQIGKYKNYIQIKIVNNKVVQLQTNSSNWEWNNKKIVGRNVVDFEEFIENEENFIEDYIEFTVVDSGEAKINYNSREKVTSDNQSVYISVLLDNETKDITFVTIGLMRDKDNIINVDTGGIVGEYTGYTPAALEGLERQIFDYTNVIREKNGLFPLIWENSLHEFSKSHSEDMARNNYVDHKNSRGEDFETRLSHIAKDKKWQSAAENIIGGIFDAAGVTNYWYNSEQRLNFLDKFDYSAVGISYNRDSDSGVYFTQDFVGYTTIKDE